MTTQRARKPSQSRADREADRRKTILRAAVEVFSKKGYHGCRIADVAREAKVAYGLVYHYFENKDELLQAVFESGWTTFLTHVEAAMTGAGTLEARIQAIVQVAFDAYARDPRGVKVLILEVGRSPSGGAVNRGNEFSSILALAAAMFEEAQAQGEISPALEPRLCAAHLFGAIEMGLTAFVLGILDRRDEAVVARARDQVASTLLRGVLGAQGAGLEAGPWNQETSGTKSKATRRA